MIAQVEKKLVERMNMLCSNINFNLRFNPRVDGTRKFSIGKMISI